MTHTLPSDLCRIFLILGCLAFVFGGASAQPRTAKKKPQAGKVETKTSKTDAAPGCKAYPPVIAAREPAFTLTTSGQITGNMSVIGIDCDGKISPLDAAKQDKIRTFFNSGIKRWEGSAANVCGTETTLSPNLNLTFPSSPNGVKGNLLYIVVGATAVSQNDGVLGKTFPLDLHNYLYWDLQFEGVRGTGTLNAITIVLADPDEVAKLTYPTKDGTGSMSGENAWKITAAHELGHAMGLLDTYIYGTLKTNESPAGYMNATQYSAPRVHEAYIASIMTRVFECRIDITTTLDKTTTSPLAVHNAGWDFLGTAVSTYSDVLTSEWGFYNGHWRTANTCTVSDDWRTSYNTYQMCSADGKIQASEIDFNLGERQSAADFLWQKESKFPVEMQEFRVGEGDCKAPVTGENMTGRPLELVKPIFTLGSNGLEMYVQDVSIENVLMDITASDPAPDRWPVCTTGASWDGKKISQSENFTSAPFTVSSSITQDNKDIGVYEIKVKMKLGTKKSGKL